MNVQIGHPPHRRPVHHQGPPAGRLGLRRLRHRRHHACRSSARCCARPSTCAATSASSTSPPATATPRWPRPAASPTSCRPTMSAPCSSADASAPKPTACRSPSRKPTPRHCPSPMRASTSCFPPSASCSRPTRQQAASELLRVCRPGGKIGLANWTPESFIGQLFRTIGKYVPPAPGVKSPSLWGTKAHLDALFGATGHGRGESRHFVFRYKSPAHWLEIFRDYYGPVLKAFAALDPEAAHGARGGSPMPCSTSSTSPRTARWSCPASISKRSSPGRTGSRRYRLPRRTPR